MLYGVGRIDRRFPSEESELFRYAKDIIELISRELGYESWQYILRRQGGVSCPIITPSPSPQKPLLRENLVHCFVLSE